MQVLLEHHACIPARIFYLDRQIASGRKSDGALEVHLRDFRTAPERRRPQSVENAEIRMQLAVLVRLVELQSPLERRLDPGQLGDGGPIVARRIEIAEPTDRIGIQIIDLLGLHYGELAHKFVVTVDRAPTSVIM